MDNLNSVCFIAKILQIDSIEDADNIELALLNGWNCIVKKNTHKVGDLVICAITDAIIPNSLSEELGIKNYLRKGERVRTIKLKNVYSECLIIPLSFIHNYGEDTTFEGKDMMGILNITKYEPPVRMVRLSTGKKIKYSENPNFKIYHKFPNIKNIPKMFDEYDYVEISRKIHGTNARYGIVKKNKLSFFDKIKKFFGFNLKWSQYEFVLGSHNVEKGSETQGFYDTNYWYEIAEKYDIKNKLWNCVKKNYTSETLGNGIVIYGEIYGKGIQKNYDYGLDDVKFFVFDMTIDDVYFYLEGTKYIVEESLGLEYSEVLYKGLYSEEIKDSFVFNNFIENTKIPHEGVVIKKMDGNRQKVAKVINPDYLIYGEKHNIGDSH